MPVPPVPPRPMPWAPRPRLPVRGTPFSCCPRAPLPGSAYTARPSPPPPGPRRALRYQQPDRFPLPRPPRGPTRGGGSGGRPRADPFSGPKPRLRLPAGPAVRRGFHHSSPALWSPGRLGLLGARARLLTDQRPPSGVTRLGAGAADLGACVDRPDLRVPRHPPGTGAGTSAGAGAGTGRPAATMSPPPRGFPSRPRPPGHPFTRGPRQPVLLHRVNRPAPPPTTRHQSRSRDLHPPPSRGFTTWVSL